jgi:hypothetical protein
VGIDKFGSEGTSLRLAYASASNVDPFLVGHLIDDVSDENPTLAPLFDAINLYGVARSQSSPPRRTHKVALAAHDWARFHTSVLLVAYLALGCYRRTVRWNYVI